MTVNKSRATYSVSRMSKAMEDGLRDTRHSCMIQNVDRVNANVMDHT